MTAVAGTLVGPAAFPLCPGPRGPGGLIDRSGHFPYYCRRSKPRVDVSYGLAIYES